MYYYPGYNSKIPQKWNLDDCLEPCYLKRFMQVTENLIPNNWEEECHNK